MAVYFATKAFVLSFSEALHEEVKRHGVSVTALCPGPTATEFGEVAGFGAAMLVEHDRGLRRRRPRRARRWTRASDRIPAATHSVASVGRQGLDKGRRSSSPA